jgi:PleD family two-component response regulator
MHPDLKVTMNLGVYGDMSAGSLDAMLAAADRLRYRAKSSGRNRVCTVDGETGMGDTTWRS